MTMFQVSAATREAQALASDPTTSVFVSANAGSGKTHVLTERVVRLLLSGADPSKILCLTYTKAAAAEMANRVFARLSAWATAPAAELRAELERLDAGTPSPDRLAKARRLFACALETPGGLKIQTIHAFCEALLHQFPLEANVPGHFEVLDDAESAMLLAEARRRLITSASASEGKDEALAQAFADALATGGEWGLDQLIAEVVAKRDAVRRHVAEAGGLEAAVGVLRRSLGLAEGENEALVVAGATPAPGLDDAFCASLLMVARTSDKKTDQTLVSRLEALRDASGPDARLAALKAICLKKDGAPYKPSSVGTKAVSDFFEDFAERLEQAGAHIAATEERLATLRLYRTSRAALVIAERLEHDYALAKRRRGRLDFEDLIVRTADLLLRSDASAWVHYKLDQGIDHILIDEAQDTSPRQWQVMRSLTQEFFVGASSRNIARTVFAVGDEKQSIYSFQGASPLMFAEERRSLEKHATDARLPFARVELHQSFRSAGGVLAAVDQVFSDEINRRGLSTDDVPPAHQTVRGEAPGLVEIWPVIQAERAAESDDWLQPLDYQPEHSPANRLARKIAGRIRDWIGDPIVVKGERRALSAGDVLILVRKRSAFVDAMGAALREAGIAVAGADRLVITDHIAVQDLMALGRTVANVEDELSLAEVLKSPLFGFSDDELMALALSRGRTESLYLALRRMAGPRWERRVPDFVAPAARSRLRERCAMAFDRIETLRDRAGFETVFAFYARILGPEGGRAKLTARLGRDAGEVIDAFLDLALAEDETGHPGLDAFLANLAASHPEIKREMEHGRGEVRIMTTHASKGLEAPVIFLVDPGSAPFSHAHGAKLMRWDAMPGLVPGQAPGFLWRAGKEFENAAVATLKDAEKALAEEEYRRLLYVGMTRAADRLVICGTAGVRGPNESSWLQRAQATLRETCREVLDADGHVEAWRFGDEPDANRKLPPLAARPGEAFARLDLSPLPPEPLPPRPLTPSSSVGGAFRVDADVEALPETEQAYVSPVLGGAAGEPSVAIRRGILVHKLLQVLPDLPPETRKAAARRYVEGAGAFLAEAEREALVASALRVMDEPAFAPIFAPGSRAEVAITGRIALAGRPYAVNGTVDRLAVTSDRVLIVDYKTLRPAPQQIDEVPSAYVLQLALYRQMLQPLYPDRPVEAALLFTEGPHLMAVEAQEMEAALEARSLAAERATHRQASDAAA